MTKNIQRIINETNKRFDNLISDLRALEATDKANISATSALSLKDLEELSMMVTRTKLFAMKLSLAHKRGEPLSMEGANYSVRLQRFSQTLQEIHDYYGKIHPI